MASPLGVRCGQLVDAQGRVVFLRGVNARVAGVFDVTFSDGRMPNEPLPPYTADDAAQMRAFGFDALRLPINWSGVEPTMTGGFDEGYLDRVSAVVDLASQAGIGVLLDLHQDAYSKEIGEDGAPLWAIIPPPTPDQMPGGPLGNLDQKRLSSVVMDAFATFFDDDGDAGTTLRARFVAMIKHVGERFAQHPGVVGVEIYNEPVFIGEAELRRVYQPAYDALHAAMPGKLVLFEPSSERNLLDHGSPTTLGPLGPNTGYAPHFYKIAFTGTDAARMAMTKETLRPQIASAPGEAASWGAALVSTEWGYGPADLRASEYLTWQSELHEQYQASAFFWLWKEESQAGWGCFDHDSASDTWTERPAMKKALARVRPAAIAGWPKSFGFDRAAGEFKLSFTADPTAQGPTEIAVASALGAPLEVDCDGAPVAGAAPDANGVLSLGCGAGDSGDHAIRVAVAPLPLGRGPQHPNPRS